MGLRGFVVGGFAGVFGGLGFAVCLLGGLVDFFRRWLTSFAAGLEAYELLLEGFSSSSLISSRSTRLLRAPWRRGSARRA